MLKIVHVINKPVPPERNSGGANRMLDWLARAQARAGHRIHIVAPDGSDTAYAAHVTLPLAVSAEEFQAAIPSDTDVIHHHGGYELFAGHEQSLKCPFIQTIHGNLSQSEECGDRQLPVNAVFVSRSHMQKYGGTHYVLNGIPVDDYLFKVSKGKSLLFLGKVRRRKKGVEQAIQVACATRMPLIVAGGWRLRNLSTWLPVSRYVRSVGLVEHAEKKDLLANSKALLAPVLWDEPFGLVVAEALASGTPVIALNRGAMPEIIRHGETGIVCDSIDEMKSAVSEIANIDPAVCRAYAQKNFSIDRVSEDYDRLYHSVIAGNSW